MHFSEKQFNALVSIDSYHYFADEQGFFQEKIRPFMKEGGVILISIPGLKEEFSGRSKELLSEWLGKEAYMFKSRKRWKELIGSHDRIESVVTWEMACFEEAWNEWFAMDNKYAQSDKEYFETVIKPYTCLIGIYVKLKR